MAVVKGVKEQVHLPLYDCVEVKPGKQLRETLTSNQLRFFVDVTGKTKLLTNMQASSLLPHWNTFEARALRVVISDLSPAFAKFDGESAVISLPHIAVLEGENASGIVSQVTVSSIKAAHIVDLARRMDHATARVEVTLSEAVALGWTTNPALTDGTLVLTQTDLSAAMEQFRQNGNTTLPALAQLFPNNGSGNVIGNFIYNTVTTFFVGEKIMIQVPTWFFPAGAGPYSEDGRTVTHGYPNPQATFRFAEPVVIETQQNFRVEIEIPESEVLKEFQRLYGPLFIWVVLDGYMTRDVQ